MRTLVKALSAAVLMAVLAVGCDNDSSTERRTTTSIKERPATSSTSPPSTAVPVVDTDTAIWPFVTRSDRYDDPVKAARSFATEFLGFVDPIVGVFMQGDTRSGEVEVKASSPGPTTTVAVRQLGPDNTWWVIAASSANLQLETPTWNMPIASPVTLAGRSIAFEAVVNVEIRQDGTTKPLASDTVMGGGTEIAPFSKAITFSQPTASRGAIVLKTLSPKDGNIAEAGVLRVRFSNLLPTIEKAFDSNNDAPIKDHMATSVEYAIAGSEAYGTVPGAQAVAKMSSYLTEARGPWSFDIPPTTLDLYKRGPYGRYLIDDTYFGVGAGQQFVSFRVNLAGKIDQIFMSAHTDLLK